MTKLAEQLKQGADQAWESLSKGWRELSARASDALTRFRPASNAWTARDDGRLPFGNCAFMAADVFDGDDRVVVRIEAHGTRREDFNVELQGDLLTVWVSNSSTRRQWAPVIASCSAPTAASAAMWRCRRQSKLTRPRPATAIGSCASSCPRPMALVPTGSRSIRPEFAEPIRTTGLLSEAVLASVSGLETHRCGL